jgi:hypothetical protein
LSRDHFPNYRIPVGADKVPKLVGGPLKADEGVVDVRDRLDVYARFSIHL